MNVEKRGMCLPTAPKDQRGSQEVEIPRVVAAVDEEEAVEVVAEEETVEEVVDSRARLEIEEVTSNPATPILSGQLTA